MQQSSCWCHQDRTVYRVDAYKESFIIFLYILCKSRTKDFCVCDTSYTEYTIYILLYISITNLGLNVGAYRKMPSVLPYFS